jgi:hypothetical protein
MRLRLSRAKTSIKTSIVTISNDVEKPKSGSLTDPYSTTRNTGPLLPLALSNWLSKVT